MYVKLYVRETGGFEQLSLVARAFAAWLLKAADRDTGALPLRGEGPLIERLTMGVGFAHGATKADRAQLRAHLPELLASGYLVVSADGLGVTIRNFLDAQRRRSPTAPV